MTACFQGVEIHGAENLHHQGSVHIGAGTVIQAEGGVRIGKGVILSFDCVVWTINHDYNENCLPYGFARVKKPIVIGDYCWFGRNVIVSPGTTVGEGAIAAIGSVLHGNIPPLSIVAGNPAKVVGYRNPQQYFQLKSEEKDLWQDQDQCPACHGEGFYLADAGVKRHWLYRISLLKPITLWLQSMKVRYYMHRNRASDHV